MLVVREAIPVAAGRANGNEHPSGDRFIERTEHGILRSGRQLENQIDLELAANRSGILEDLSRRGGHRAQTTAHDVGHCLGRRLVGELDAHRVLGQAVDPPAIDEGAHDLLDEKCVAFGVPVDEPHHLVGWLTSECAREPPGDGVVAEGTQRDPDDALESPQSLAHVGGDPSRCCDLAY